jgi:hypothetical protein
MGLLKYHSSTCRNHSYGPLQIMFLRTLAQHVGYNVLDHVSHVSVTIIALPFSFHCSLLFCNESVQERIRLVICQLKYNGTV